MFPNKRNKKERKEKRKKNKIEHDSSERISRQINPIIHVEDLYSTIYRRELYTGVRKFNRQTFRDCWGAPKGLFFAHGPRVGKRVVTSLRQTEYSKKVGPLNISKNMFYKKLFYIKFVGCKKIYLLIL